MYVTPSIEFIPTISFCPLTNLSFFHCHFQLKGRELGEENWQTESEELDDDDDDEVSPSFHMLQLLRAHRDPSLIASILLSVSGFDA